MESGSPQSSRSGSSALSLEDVEDVNYRRNLLERDTDSEFSDVEPLEAVREQKNIFSQSPEKNDLVNVDSNDVNPDTEPIQVESEQEDLVPIEKNAEEKVNDEDGETHAANDRSTEDEEVDAPITGKKTSRKPKKKVEKRTAFDGRDVVFVTECTQTDWNWREKMEKSGRWKTITPRTDVTPASGRSETGLKSILEHHLVTPTSMSKAVTHPLPPRKLKPESREAVSRTHTDGESTMDTRTATDITPFSLQPNDEFGIPLLDMSSDSDSSDEDAPKKSRSHRHHLPTIGPPQILKYVRESDRQGMYSDRTSSELDDEHRFLESTDYLSSGQSPGMFGGPCEFCGNDIKPFPSLEQQLSIPPESLYCCEEYREFVEFAMTTANKLEEDVAKKNEKISIKVHPHHGSKQARKMAKEQAVQRMREREMQRRQQEATGMQAAYFNSGNMSQAGMVSRAGKNAGGSMLFKDMASYGSSSTGEVYASDVLTARKKAKDGGGGKKEDIERKAGEGGRRGDTTGGGGSGGASFPAGPGGYGSANAVAAGIPGMAYGPGAPHTGLFGPEVARQMKTINYQLSSQRCLEEGWTLRPPSPLDLDDLDAEIFVPEPLHPAMIASGRLYDRKLIEKFYPDGSKFLTMFPDGTGNVFYPSGQLAILILSIALGQYTYIVYDDGDDPELLAIFGPNGIGCCHFANGKIRLNYDQMEGLELDISGGKKRLWSWKDQETHVHAPPFQPIVFGMNRYIGVRFMAQDSIALTLTGRKRSCRFNVGAKLRLACPENLQPKMIDENQLFIDERKVCVDAILDKVSTLLKFPKSPKVDKILPPLSIKSRQQKVEKLKSDYASLTQAQSGGKKSKKVKQARLSPLPVISVN